MDTAIAMTVLGPVDPADLGITLPHEHLLIDLRCLKQAPTFRWQDDLQDGDLQPERRGDLSLDPYVSNANLQLDDPSLAAQEIATFGEAGGKTIVDLTVDGIRPRPLTLKEISLQTGLHVVAGCGMYVQRAHPEWVAPTSEEAIVDRLLHDVRIGFGNSGVRPGILGEIGTSSPVHAVEEKVLRSTARVQRETGLALNIHLSIFGGQAVHVLDILEAAGADLSRVVMSHMDEMPDLNYHRAVLERGAFVEFDTFGSEFTFLSSGTREPGDGQRMDLLLHLLHGGWKDRILLSQDVCTRMHLRRYGGYGYSHLLRAVVPQLRRRGVDDETLETLLVRNPANVLAHQP